MSPVIAEGFKQRIPWFAKIPLKIILSRLPVGWRAWQRLNLFRAGGMDDFGYAFRIFKQHYEASGLQTLRDCTVVEVGPGNGMLTALFARSFGAARTYLVDSEALISPDPALLTRAADMLAEQKLSVPQFNGASVVVAMEQLKATYFTGGTASLRDIGDGQVDFLFSNAVLEHIRLGEFGELIRETRRILKLNGVASHVIDFRDHLQNGLNNLRFSERVWESGFMARSGFYTNRIPWPAMKKIFEVSGFSCEMRFLEKWPDGLPTPQARMSSPFREAPADDLMVLGAHVILRPVQRSGF
jgi:SAM-dependent methyltransferase